MPIIKSKGRKDTNFKQLIDYLFTQDEEIDSFTILNNIFVSNPEDRQGITKAFLKNDSYRKRRVKGNGMYHEILAFHPKDKEVILGTPGLLEDFAREYIEARAPNALTLIKPHIDKDHIHLHFMISANQYESEKGVRISKPSYFKLHQLMEDLQIRKYPDLKFSHTSRKKKFKSKELNYTDKEWKVKNTNRVLKIDSVRKAVLLAANQANSLIDFKEKLKEVKLELYKRGDKIYGVKEFDSNRKYRFKTLFKDSNVIESKLKLWQQQSLRKGKVKEEGVDLDLDLELGLEIDF